MSDLELTQKYSVREPTAQDGIFVPTQQWRRTMERIKNCGEHTGFYEALGWSCIGFGASALLSALINLGGMKFYELDATTKAVIAVHYWAVISEVCCWVFGAAGVGMGIVSLRFAKTHAKDRAEIRLMIVEDMADYESKFHKPLVAATQQQVA